MRDQIDRLVRMRAVRGTVIALAVLPLAGCGSSGASHPAAKPPTTSHGSTTTTAARHVLVATFADDGGTLSVQTGDRIRVVLAGTSWSQDSSAPAVVQASSKPTVLPASTGCVKGQGCGSVTVYYQAEKPGQAQIVGDRAHCSQAGPACRTGPGAFRLIVDVAKP